MNEFETLLNSVEDVKVRDVVKGEILSVENGQATVAIVGTGVEGVLTLREITNDKDADINTFVKPGDVLDLLVIKQIFCLYLTISLELFNQFFYCNDFQVNDYNQKY